MDPSKYLPPLHISKLNPVPDWEAKAKYDNRDPIAFVLRNQFAYQPCGEKEINSWSIKIYRAKEKAHARLGMQLGIEEEISSENEFSSEEGAGSYEYLIFLFQKAQSDNVFVLSTSKAYKQIRNECSMQFSRNCSMELSPLFTRIQQVSTSQVFGPVSDSTMSLRNAYPETVNQSGSIYREFSAIGSNFKVKFKENGIIIFKEMTLENYVSFVQDIAPNQPIIEWGIPGIPDCNLVHVEESLQDKLNENICLYLAGLKVPGWTFCLRISDRWHSNAMKFRLCTERRRYGCNSGGGIERSEIPLPGGPRSPDLDLLMLYFNYNILPVQTSQVNGLTDSMRKFNVHSIFNRQVAIEYHTINDQWCRQPLIDAIEGWVRTEEKSVYFKLGTIWYHIQKDYVNLVQQSLNRVISLPGCLLAKEQSGYLFLPWSQGNETNYNRSYLQCNRGNSLEPCWFDGNQKFRSRVEIFDILQIHQEEVFVYHVKMKFDTHIREAVSQLITSAQLIYNSRNSESMHPDAIETRAYCTKVAGHASEKLFQALRGGKLHFVLAFQSNGANDMLNSASLIAKREVIRAKEEIEKLGFSFKISPIPIE